MFYFEFLNYRGDNCMAVRLQATTNPVYINKVATRTPLLVCCHGSSSNKPIYATAGITQYAFI